MSRKALREQQARRDAAAQELHTLRAGLTAAFSSFNHTADPMLLEASILEIGALQSRYCSALRAMKALYANA